ncbi:MAG: TIGR04211 family SH3 domain-containing protein [Desulfotignum sp.]|nr:TIGR04211 family SH3 domain-containing protein [Desulfotignum sp.]MCF8112772.1 TIGR04211 family SH3 domain-containing protein [Desulfotignum sp.]MCF8125151.1 TIGR04211 family SH3 domain-containing protein [Desulfotignum sp.]
MRVFSICFLTLVILCTGVFAYGQSSTGYVSDMLILTFRQGPGPSYQVLKTLESNTPLTILDEEGDYFKVQLSSGETGWVDKQFVTFDLPKTLIIEELKEENTALKKQLDDLKDQTASALKKYEALKERSGDVLQIIEENKALEKENKQLSQNLALLENESDHFFKDTMIKWFLAGFGVIFLGWLLGQRVSGRKRRPNSILD